MAFELHRPHSLEEAIAMAAALGPTSRFIAGGTDLVVQINRKRLAPEHLISLPKLDLLTRIAAEDGMLRIGALATHKAFERAVSHLPGCSALREAARVVGGHQVRNIGTVGGNVVNASPAADLVAALHAFDPDLHLRGPNGTRAIALGDFATGPGATVRRPDEVLTEIRMPLPGARAGSAFLKAGRRRAMEIAVVSIACRVELEPDGLICSRAAIALGAVAPTIVRARQAEAFLAGRALVPDVLKEAARLTAACSAPLTDVRASSRYRLHLVEVLTARAVAEAARRATGEGRDVAH